MTIQLVESSLGDNPACHPCGTIVWLPWCRQAVLYREGRVLLAGDAAHIRSPHGGQGLITGVQDGVNLGWKLARVVDRRATAGLLDTYHAERHPVAARVLENTMAQVALSSGGDRHRALRNTMTQLGAPRPRRGRCTGGGADPPRRPRRVDRRPRG